MRDTFLAIYAAKAAKAKATSNKEVWTRSPLCSAQAHSILAQDGGSDSDTNDFGNFSLNPKTVLSKTHELDEYLRLPVENIKELLMWWMKNAHTYLVLSRMALDYLSVPGMSLLYIQKSILILTRSSNIDCCRTGILARPPSSLIHTQPPLTSNHLRKPMFRFMVSP